MVTHNTLWIAIYLNFCNSGFFTIERIYSQLEIYPFDELSARKYSIIRTQLEKDGLVISERDLQIASIAMANKLIVVTHNVKEFKRIEKLDVEDWAKTG